MRTHWLRVVLLALLLAATRAEAAVHVTGNERWPLVLDDQVELFEDTSSQLTLDQVQALAMAPAGTRPGFAPASAARLQPGFTRSTFWVRLVVVNDSQVFQPLRLALGSPRLHHVDFYLRTSLGADAAWTRRRAGAALPLSEHAVPSRDPLLMLDLPAGAEAQVLVRISSEGSIQIQPTLSRTEVRAATELRNTLTDGLLVGGLLVLSAYSLMLSVLSRSRALIWQGVAFSVLAVYEISYRGLGKIYLWPESTDWSVRGPGVLGGLCALVLIFYLRSLVRQLGARLPAMGFFMALAVAQVLIALGTLFGNYFVFVQINLWTVPFIAVCLVIAGFVLARRSQLGNRLFLAAVVIAFVSICMRTIELAGFAPWLVPGANPYASGFSAAIVALVALMVWINHMSFQRQTAQKQVIDRQALYQRELEQEVDRQTRALSGALAELTETNRRQMRIMTYVAHDLRSPLATIVGHARVLQGRLESAQLRMAQAVERNAIYQLTLIDDLLEFARPDPQRMSIHPEPTHLPRLLDDIQPLVAQLARRQGNGFSILRLSDLPEWVLIDGKRLRRVLTNLLENAAKFTRDGGIILAVNARTDAEGCYGLSFEVADTGIGIAIEDQARIFASFERASRDSRGLGLGLFIAQRLVERMGGTLKVVSQLDQGSRFSFELVVAAAEPPPRAEHEEPPEDHAAPRAIPAAARPPAPALAQLMRLADGGQWSDIDEWIHRLAASHPQCGPFLDEVRAALEDLDFERIERMASPDDAAPGAPVDAAPST